MSSTTIALPPHASVITYTDSVPTSPTHTPTQQPHTTPIAHFASTPNSHPTGSLVAVSKAYIVYAVKNGLVRVIDRQKALRTLLRGHSKRVTDLAFFPQADGGNNNNNNVPTSDVLGTVGGEGDAACVLIWRIYAKPPGATGDEIGSEKLLEVRYKPAVRMIWHPLNPNQFFLLDRASASSTENMGGGGGVVVETTRLVTSKSPTDGHAVCLCGDNNMDLGQAGVRLRNNAFGQEGCVDMDWSRWNDRLVAICGGGGKVILWNWEVGGKIMSILDASDNDDAASGGEVIDSFMFVYRMDGMMSNFDKNAVKKHMTEPFITGTKGNSQITLWSNFQTMDDGMTISANKMRVLNMGYAPSASSFHMSMCSGAGSFYDVPKAYIVLADRNSGSLYAIHIGTEQIDEYKLATGFDSLTPFQVMHPILSWNVMGEMVIDDQEEEDEEEEEGGEKFEVSLFCVQSKAVQMLKLKPKMLRRPKVDNEAALDLPSNITVEYLETNNNNSNSEDISNHDEQNNMNEELDAAHYEYEDDDESFEDPPMDDDDDDDDEGENEDDSNESSEYGANITPPLATTLPPPGLTNISTNDSNSFSNWLGAIASVNISSAPTNVSLPPPSEPVVAPKPPASPLPIKPPVVTASTAAPEKKPPQQQVPQPQPIRDLTPPVPKPIQAQPKVFLSPVELISSSNSLVAAAEESKPSPSPPAPPLTSSTTTNAAPAKKSNPNAAPKQPSGGGSSGASRKKSPKRSSQNDSAKFKKSSPPTPKIQILKREQPLPNTTTTTSSEESTGGGVNMEESLKRTLVAQFKIHEATVITEFQRTLKSETKNLLLPALTKNILQGMEQNVGKPLHANLAKGIKDREKKMVKEVVEGICSEVKYATTKAFQENMRKVFVPAYEAATQQMFSQISETLENTQRQSQNETNQLIQSLVTQISTLSNQVTSLSTELATMRNTIQNQQGWMGAGSNIGGLPGSISAPPDVPQQDPIQVLQDEILALLSETNYAAAFTKALSASSAETAVFCCKHADISSLLDNDNSILSQPILLCLMQQLGSVLSLPPQLQTEADVFMITEWLQDIAVSINPTDVSIKNHVTEITNSVMENIHGKLNTVGIDGKLRRKLQMLLQVIRGVGY